MATRFEVVMYGDDPVHLRAAGEEALDEIDRLEAQLSFYRSESELSYVNARAAEGWVAVTPPLFYLLRDAQRLSRATLGAFDPTIAPLMRCWGFAGESGRVPDPAELRAARETVGMDLVHLDGESFAVRFERPGASLDLGAIGKGYAVERAAALLRENGIESALLHGGTSTIAAIGAPPGEAGWTVALQHPFLDGERIGSVTLKDTSLSVSAPHGKAFEAGGALYGHVMDPRTGEPVRGAVLAAVSLPSATETDALSTALLVLGEPGFPNLEEAAPDSRALVASRDETGPGGLRLATHRWDPFETTPTDQS
jgi:thiamine biosynthesis lipoprotein